MALLLSGRPSRAATLPAGTSFGAVTSLRLFPTIYENLAAIGDTPLTCVNDSGADPAETSIRQVFLRHQHRLLAIDVGIDAFETVDLRQVVENDVGLRRMQFQ